MKKTFCFTVFLAALLAAVVGAQELVYDPPNQISYDAVEVYYPRVVFNGIDHGVFFFWQGKADFERGLHFRRLDEDAKPVGPQRKMYDIGRGDVEFMNALWDGENYLLAFGKVNNISHEIWLLRVSRNAKVLAQKKIAEYDADIINTDEAFPFLFLIGDEVYLFFTYQYGRDYAVYLARIGLDLSGEAALKQLPFGDLKRPFLIGAAHDPDKFLVLIGENRAAPYPWDSLKGVRLLHVGFDGSIILNPKPFPNNAGLPPGEWYYNAFFSSPVYVGDGYVMVYAESILYDWTAPPPGAGSNFPYYNQSFKVDEEGNIISGPFNLGDNLPLIPGPAALAGNHVCLLMFDSLRPSTSAFLFGRKGGHIGSLQYFTYWDTYYWMYWASYAANSSQAYTGTANTIVYRDYKTGVDTSAFVFNANQYTMPPFTKPGFFYFQAGTTEPVKDHRLVMWSVVGGRNVTLTGPDFELKDLPPVWSYLVDTKGQNTKLTLSFTTEDGKTLSRKLRIKP